jgi:hypothetical protein
MKAERLLIHKSYLPWHLSIHLVWVDRAVPLDLLAALSMRS